MANSSRNREGIKGSGNETRKGIQPENRGNRKVADNNRDGKERISTAGDTSNPKYSKTSVRKEDKERMDSSDLSG